MNRLRQGWVEKAFVTAEAEALAAASEHFGGDVPREADALIAGASASAIDAIQGIPALGKLWGRRGDKRKADGLVRVLALHAISTWLTSDEGVDPGHDAAAFRTEWARDVLHIFGMDSDQNLDQFRLRDLQATHEQAGNGDGLVSYYLLMSDMLRALGDSTRGPLVQAPSIPLESYNELIISDSFRQRISREDLAYLQQIAAQNKTICRDAYRGASGHPSKQAGESATREDEDLAAAAEPLDAEPEPAEAVNGGNGAQYAAASGAPPVSSPVLTPASEGGSPPAEPVAPHSVVAAEEPAVAAAEPAAGDELNAGDLDEGDAADAGAQTYSFDEEGVGIASEFDEGKMEWRDLGLARGAVVGRAGLPLRVSVNLSLRTAIAALDDEPQRRLQSLQGAALAQSAGTALVPLEFEYLRQLACPRCGSARGLNQLQQESLEEDYHPAPDGWPYASPAGDRVTLGCPECDFLFEVVFWFWE